MDAIGQTGEAAKENIGRGITTFVGPGGNKSQTSTTDS